MNEKREGRPLRAENVLLNREKTAMIHTSSPLRTVDEKMRSMLFIEKRKIRDGKEKNAQ